MFRSFAPSKISLVAATVGIAATWLFSTVGVSLAEQATGNDVSISDPHGAMEHFYKRLGAVQQKQAGAVARISVYGTSTNGADRITSRMRHLLQKQFGDAGKGFMVIAPGWSSHQHRDVDWTYHTFRTLNVNRGEAPGNRYGLGGVLAINRGIGSRASFGTVDSGPSNRKVSLFRLFYQAWPQGGEILLEVEGGASKRVSTSSKRVEDRVAELRVPIGPHKLWVKVGDGSLRLYGVAMENDGPGVVVDGLSLIGASVRMMNNFDGPHLTTQVKQRSPDLLLFWLGGNDVPAKHFSHDIFVERYGLMIKRARAGRPEASCLVVSVLDKGHYKNGRVRSRHWTLPVIKAQQEVAQKQRCAFYNLWEATGGEGTMGRWHTSSPRLSVADYMHLTEAGARHVGDVITKALLDGYQR